jgi:hypothetical protein
LRGSSAESVSAADDFMLSRDFRFTSLVAVVMDYSLSKPRLYAREEPANASLTLWVTIPY